MWLMKDRVGAIQRAESRRLLCLAQLAQKVDEAETSWVRNLLIPSLTETRSCATLLSATYFQTYSVLFFVLLSLSRH
jgi:hypothetical protein